LMHAWADMRTGGYVSYPLDSHGRYATVDLAHHWGMPSLGACFGTDSPGAGTWQSAAETALDTFLVGLTGAEIVTGMGLARTYTLLHPEQLIMDSDLYHRARYYLQAVEVSPETLALDVIGAVKPGGHFLLEKHTIKHMRQSMLRAITHHLDDGGHYRDPQQVAREQVRWILDHHHPEPLEEAKRTELARILAAAQQELSE
jgi:trimethylamine--corrinoid protein Co-methyltransferase